MVSIRTVAALNAVTSLNKHFRALVMVINRPRALFAIIKGDEKDEA